MSQEDAWLFGVLIELGIVDRPNWVHVALALGPSIRGRVRTSVTVRGKHAMVTIGLECEDDARVPGFDSGRLELFGLRCEADPVEVRPSTWKFSMTDGDLVIEPWRRYAFPDNTRLYAQVDCRPNSRESASIHGGEFDEGRASDADFARVRATQRALLTLKDIELRRGGGGPRGISRREARSRLLKLADLAVNDGNQIDPNSLAMYTTRSRRTVSYWLERAEWGIEDVRIQLPRYRLRQSARKSS